MNLSKTEMDDLQTIPRDWIFTFGIGHGYENCFIKVHGTIRTSRETMNKLFGSRWFLQYPSEMEAGTKKWNLKEIDVNDIPHLRGKKAKRKK